MPGCRFVSGRSEHWLQRLREALEAEPAAGLGEVRWHALVSKRCLTIFISSGKKPYWHIMRLGLVTRAGVCRALTADVRPGKSHLWGCSATNLIDASPQCGLDKARRGADMDTQVAVFRQQLRLGQELRRPVSVRLIFYLESGSHLLCHPFVPPLARSLGSAGSAYTAATRQSGKVSHLCTATSEQQNGLCLIQTSNLDPEASSPGALRTAACWPSPRSRAPF